MQAMTLGALPPPAQLQMLQLMQHSELTAQQQQRLLDAQRREAEEKIKRAAQQEERKRREQQEQERLERLRQQHLASSNHLSLKVPTSSNVSDNNIVHRHSIAYSSECSETTSDASIANTDAQSPNARHAQCEAASVAVSRFDTESTTGGGTGELIGAARATATANDANGRHADFINDAGSDLIRNATDGGDAQSRYDTFHICSHQTELYSAIPQTVDPMRRLQLQQQLDILGATIRHEHRHTHLHLHTPASAVSTSVQQAAAIASSAFTFSFLSIITFFAAANSAPDMLTQLMRMDPLHMQQMNAAGITPEMLRVHSHRS